MIETTAELLDSLKTKEQQLLQQYDIIEHPVLIGTMYEGLSKDLLHKALFKVLGLKVTAGKIKGNTGKLSSEIDCMIVVGNGEQIPYTDKYIYPVEKVVAVIEVKKNLYSAEVAGSYENLRTVIEINDNGSVTAQHKKMQQDAYELICQRKLPSKAALSSEPTLYEMMYHILLLESVYPARIVWGYNGFKSEFALRESFVNYLEGNLTKDPENKIFGYGPLNFPNLIICDSLSLIKSNGMPFATPIIGDEWWPVYLSSNKTPLLHLLEIIWTRLQYLFELSADIFGEDLTNEQLHLFISAKMKKEHGLTGWEYHAFPFTKQQLEQPLADSDWSPVSLKETEFLIINILCTVEEINYITDAEFAAFLGKHSKSLGEILLILKKTGLVATEKNMLTLLTEQCKCVITPDGKYYAGDNKTGRVDRWMAKNFPGFQ